MTLFFRYLNGPVRMMARVQGDPASIGPAQRRAYLYPLARLADRAAPLALARMVPDSLEHPTVAALAPGEAWAAGFAGPVRLVWGTRDPIMGPALRGMRKLFPAAPVVETQAGHFLQEEVPEVLAEAILAVAGCRRSYDRAGHPHGPPAHPRPARGGPAGPRGALDRPGGDAVPGRPARERSGWRRRFGEDLGPDAPPFNLWPVEETGHRAGGGALRHPGQGSGRPRRARAGLRAGARSLGARAGHRGGDRPCATMPSRALGLDRLVSLIEPGNAASERVARKVGMALERETVRPGGKVMRVYAVGPPGLPVPPRQ